LVVAIWWNKEQAELLRWNALARGKRVGQRKLCRQRVPGRDPRRPNLSRLRHDAARRPRRPYGCRIGTRSAVEPRRSQYCPAPLTMTQTLGYAPSARPPTAQADGAVGQARDKRQTLARHEG